MKYVDLDKLKEIPGRRIEAEDTFSFRCHPGIGCFNRCCRNLNLFLYPYDVLRLKNALGISSDEFLDQYVDVVLRSGNFFPEVLLRMSPNEEKDCTYRGARFMRIVPIPAVCFQWSMALFMMPPLKKISRYIFSDRRIFAWDRMKTSSGPYRGGPEIRTRCFIKK
jgi:hypothetical protein